MLEEYASSAMMFQTGCDSKRINLVWLRLTWCELFGELCAALHVPAPCVCAPFGKLFNKPDVPLELTQSKPCHLLISRNCVFDTSFRKFPSRDAGFEHDLVTETFEALNVVAGQALRFETVEKVPA
jgi:hypothetical protein